MNRSAVNSATIHVAVSQSIAGNIQLADHVFGRGIQVLVQDVDPDIGGRPPNGHGLTLIAYRIKAVDHATDSRFRWSILVEYLDLPAETFVHLRRQTRCERLTTDDQIALLDYSGYPNP